MKITSLKINKKKYKSNIQVVLRKIIFKKAVERNKIKRWVRHIMRNLKLINIKVYNISKIETTSYQEFKTNIEIAIDNSKTE